MTKTRTYSLLFVLVLCLIPIFLTAQELGSPDGNFELSFALSTQGEPTYTLAYKGKTVVKPSILGIELKNTEALTSGFKLTDAQENAVDTTWVPVWGEQKEIRNNYNELAITLSQAQEQERTLLIKFRLFNDGLGFRYEFPHQANLKHFIITKELTQFNLTGDHKAFWIPADYDSNEYIYTTSKLSEIDGYKDAILSFGDDAHNRPDQDAVKTPLMLKSEDGLYINIHEAALINYPVMELHVDKASHSLSAQLAPDVMGNKAYLRTPFTTPWRTLIVSDDARDVLASKLILNLNEPSKIEDPSYIKPMKYMGVWWEMQIGKSRWDYTNDLDTFSENGNLIPNNHHAANTANVKRYIDFASENGIAGLLVEGWNTGWEEWLADYEDKFDFVTPYPDFDIAEITSYASQKGVQMIMHNETGASASKYDQKMEAAYDYMNEYGYNAVKTGYVGSVIPRGEHHDGQWMVSHFLRSVKTADAHQVMINIHEAVRPTGLHRTWPNFMASEAGRGNEWNAFSIGSPPEHETILPFTRLIGGPMDYTPGIFKLKEYAASDLKRQMHSTLAKQLALYVTMYSPLQMAADLPEHYEAHIDAFKFIQDVAVDWDDTFILEAEPGDYITIARKAKGENEWFLGGVTDENARTATINFVFLPKGKTYTATIYADGKNASWDKNPEDYTIETIRVTSKSKLKQKLAAGGGVAISIKEQ
ncbi:MAG: glycoside hydrolase family 97 protein [Leeuwenhoekiella sp.]